MGSTRIIRSVLLLTDPLVPGITVAVERASSVPINLNIIASEDESGRLILVPYVHGVFQPILDISAELFQATLITVVDQ